KPRLLLAIDPLLRTGDDPVMSFALDEAVEGGDVIPRLGKERAADVLLAVHLQGLVLQGVLVGVEPRLLALAQRPQADGPLSSTAERLVTAWLICPARGRQRRHSSFRGTPLASPPLQHVARRLSSRLPGNKAGHLAVLQGDPDDGVIAPI